MNAFVKFSIGIAAAATGCYLLRRSGGDKKVVQAVAKTGEFVTNVAVIGTSAAIDGGCIVADTAITAATVTAEAAAKGVEVMGYGVGRSARAVLDVTSAAGASVSGNPLSRGVVRGFYAPEAQSPVEKTYEEVTGGIAPATT